MITLEPAPYTFNADPFKPSKAYLLEYLKKHSKSLWREYLDMESTGKYNADVMYNNLLEDVQIHRTKKKLEAYYYSLGFRKHGQHYMEANVRAILSHCETKASSA